MCTSGGYHPFAYRQLQSQVYTRAASAEAVRRPRELQHVSIDLYTFFPIIEGISAIS